MVSAQEWQLWPQGAYSWEQIQWSLDTGRWWPRPTELDSRPAQEARNYPDTQMYLCPTLVPREITQNLIPYEVTYQKPQNQNPGNFFKDFFFNVDLFFKYWICNNTVSVLYFGFWPQGTWDLSSLTSDEPVPEGEVLTFNWTTREVPKPKQF